MPDSTSGSAPTRRMRKRGASRPSVPLTSMISARGCHALAASDCGWSSLICGSPPQCSQVAQRSEARQEEVAASAHGDEVRNRMVPPAHRPHLDAERGSALMQTEQRVLVVVQAVEVRVHGPRVLDELELAREIGADADEVQAAIGAVDDVVEERARVDRGPVLASPA